MFDLIHNFKFLDLLVECENATWYEFLSYLLRVLQPSRYYTSIENQPLFRFERDFKVILAYDSAIP